MFKILLALVLLSSQIEAQSPAKLEQAYKQATWQSMSLSPDKRYEALTAIRRDNPNLRWKDIEGQAHVLVVTWKSEKVYGFYKPALDSTGLYLTGKFDTWVTAVPDLQARMKREKYKDPDLRLKQLLGLPPQAEYAYFIEIWVRPEDLFRPCIDPETDDRACNLCGQADSSHQAWLSKERNNRFYHCDWTWNYPWTQLGYTYDWHPKNKTHIGLSEFVIRQNARVWLKAAHRTADYLKLSE